LKLTKNYPIDSRAYYNIVTFSSCCHLQIRRKTTKLLTVVNETKQMWTRILVNIWQISAWNVQQIQKVWQ